MIKLLLGISILLIGQQTYAQNEDDALRYTQTFFGGTARNSGMAGAMTAFGGDFSVAAQNPAGLARIRKSNFSTTLNIESMMANTDFYGSATKDQGTAGNLSNISYVKAYELNPKKYNNWYSVQIGMGMTRIKSFNQRIEYGGSADSSILHSFINEAAGIPDSSLYDNFPFSSWLAYWTYGIDPIEGTNDYSTEFSSGESVHNRSITRRGGMSEYSFTLSGNYANKLYLGGAFNMTRVKYEETFSHKESFTNEDLWLRNINYTGSLDVEGLGYNLRLGAIYLPVDWVSVGLSAQLPTVYNLSDSWSNNMTTVTNDGTNSVGTDDIPYGAYDYRVNTPFKGNLSLGLVLQKFGSIGMEVEYVDYSSASLKSRRYSDSPYDFIGENMQIENLYKSAFNYKIGAEARINSQTYLRGGFALYDSPYEAEKGNQQYPTLFYTGGAGYNWGKVYIDAACVLKRSKADYYAYDPTINGSMATIDQTNLNFKFTLGLRLD
ncbi:MAG: hypothetical protein P8I55_08805 [Crocinitomix sp.]|nr:hypothetical protein [Crocinitomix sp.]